MLVTFHSDAYENITYFGDIAAQLLTLMGHSGAIPGAIKSHDLPQALNHLQQGLQNKNVSSSQEEDDEEEVEIDLVKRAIPLVNLLQASIKSDCDVLWDAQS
ncbi:MAG: DUF1840 domain-containing protein [Legionella sp.]|uniref:DUF1840 domain-containing protein n=1 Tax=Legionella sp. TaxID=459 RepID=UPI0039E3F36C